MTAAITVDPDGVGAVDVRLGPDGSTTLLVNPLSDALDFSEGIYIGYDDDGTLRLDSGSSLSNEFGRVGSSQRGRGEVTVDGRDTVWTSKSSLGVGGLSAEDPSMLNITNGATVNSNTGVVSGGAHATISESGSTWSTQSYLLVSSSTTNAAVLSITHGGGILSGDALIGNGVEYIDGVASVTIDGDGSEWYVNGTLRLGPYGQNSLDVTGGARLVSDSGEFGSCESCSNVATISGNGSAWSLVGSRSWDRLTIRENSTLNILDGGEVVSSRRTSVGTSRLTTTAHVNVDGHGSRWTCTWDLRLDPHSDFNITNGALVSVAGTLQIVGGIPVNASIDMATGGMLALRGKGDDSLSQYLDLIESEHAIRFWDDSLLDWAPITDATPGVDYTLRYLTTGDLAGYTLLTVGSVPEPASLAVLACLAVLAPRRRSPPIVAAPAP